MGGGNAKKKSHFCRRVHGHTGKWLFGKFRIVERTKKCAVMRILCDMLHEPTDDFVVPDA